MSRRMQMGAALVALFMGPAPCPPDRCLSSGSVEGLNTMQATSPLVELLLPPKARLGDTVEITLRLRNDGNRPIDLQLTGRPVAFDIVVLRADGTEVWRRLARSVVSSALMLVRMEPGGARDFVAQWPQVDNYGRPVVPGSYRVRGTIPTSSGFLTAAPRDLVIESGH